MRQTSKLTTGPLISYRREGVENPAKEKGRYAFLQGEGGNRLKQWGERVDFRSKGEKNLRTRRGFCGSKGGTA